MKKQRILVTGGTGYLGSHTCVALMAAGFEPVIIDNLANSDRAVLGRIERITGVQPAFHPIDIRDEEQLTRLVADVRPQATLHFAGLKAVGESVEQPLAYYDNNVNGTLVLLRALALANAKTVVFSSSATVYGDPDNVPIPESAAIGPTNPYGHSKAMVERILFDTCAADTAWHVAILRYFNPVGAHPSGLIGEAPRGVPNNLVPYIAQTAVGRREFLSVFGNDWPTTDGTGVRDYIHVMDLAEGHVAALRYALANPGAVPVNLGTGTGNSVLEMLRAYERASGRRIPYRFAPRRPGDIASCYADTALASRLLGWRATRTIDDMCEDSWRWQAQNPDGYT